MVRTCNCFIFNAALFLLAFDLGFPALAQLNQVSTEIGNAKSAKNSSASDVTMNQQLLLPRREAALHQTKLDKLVSLPGLSDYPGKAIFLNGHTGAADNISSTFESFFVGDDPEKVGEWYSRILSSNDWKKMGGTPTSIVATNKAGGRVVVVAMPCNRDNIKGSLVSLTYTTSKSGGK